MLELIMLIKFVCNVGKDTNYGTVDVELLIVLSMV